MGRTRTRTAAGLVLDTGALIALDRRDKRMIALLHRALAQGRSFRVPAGVVGQAWRSGRVGVLQLSKARARYARMPSVQADIQLDRPLHTQEVRGSSPCAPTTLQGNSTRRATHVLPRKLVIRASWRLQVPAKRSFKGTSKP